jgi:hypothetical protein
VRFKRFIRRAFWLAAWGAWIWCGFGLARELPRAPWLYANKLSVDSRETVFGFLHGDNSVVCYKMSNGRPQISLLDARTSRRIQTSEGAAIGFSHLSLRHGVVVGISDADWRSRDRRSQGPMPLSSLNLRTGEWKDLGLSFRRVFGFHPEKTLVAVSLNDDETEAPRVAVVDVMTAQKIAECHCDKPPDGTTDEVIDCSFVGDGELLFVLQRRITGSDLAPTHRFEHWNINGGRSRPSGEINAYYHYWGRPTASGRIRASRANTAGFGRDILDTTTGRLLTIADDSSANDLAIRTIRRRNEVVIPKLSRDGRAVLDSHGRLIDLDLNRVIWSPDAGFEEVGSAEAAIDFDPPVTSFVVAENWKNALPRLPDVLARPTYAFRRLDDGRVCFRGRGPLPEFSHRSFDDRLWLARVSFANGVREFHLYDVPPPIDWTLLVLSQAVLALPILLIWFVLRRRRIRRLRRTISVLS